MQKEKCQSSNVDHLGQMGNDKCRLYISWYCIGFPVTTGCINFVIWKTEKLRRDNIKKKRTKRGKEKKWTKKWRKDD